MARCALQCIFKKAQVVVFFNFRYKYISCNFSSGTAWPPCPESWGSKQWGQKHLHGSIVSVLRVMWSCWCESVCMISRMTINRFPSSNLTFSLMLNPLLSNIIIVELTPTRLWLDTIFSETLNTKRVNTTAESYFSLNAFSLSGIVLATLLDKLLRP